MDWIDFGFDWVFGSGGVGVYCDLGVGVVWVYELDVGYFFDLCVIVYVVVVWLDLIVLCLFIYDFLFFFVWF